MLLLATISLSLPVYAEEEMAYEELLNAYETLQEDYDALYNEYLNLALEAGYLEFDLSDESFGDIGDEALKNIDYEISDLDEYGQMYMVTNNNDYNVSLRIDAYYLDNNENVIDTWCDEVVCIEPGKEYPLYLYYPIDENGDIADFADTTIEWTIYDASNYISRDYLEYETNPGNEKMIATITNTASEETSYRASFILYKDGQIINHCEWGEFIIESGEEQVIECEYPYIENYGLCEPDDCIVYIG